MNTTKADEGGKLVAFTGRRRKLVTLWMSLDEFEMLDEVARARGMSRSAAIRWIVREAWTSDKGREAGR